jgi:hypothetical protein
MRWEVEMHAEAATIAHAHQHMRALERANQVRLARAALKRRVATGEADVGEIVLGCPWMAETMSVGELLASQKQWGRTRSRKFLGSIGLTETKTLVSLTGRQRTILVSLLLAKRGEVGDVMTSQLAS